MIEKSLNGDLVSVTNYKLDRQGEKLLANGLPLSGSSGNAVNCDFGNSYLVDPASSHMLVSKIKPCMSKYKQLYTVKLRMAH